MEHEKIEQRLKNAIEISTPNIFDEVANEKIIKMGERDMIMEGRKKTNKRKQFIAACSSLAAVFVIGLGILMSTNAVESIIEIDVNPGIEITANKNDKVVGVTALNDDAEEVIESMNLKNVEINVAVNAIIGSMMKLGYVSGTDGAILVTVINDDVVKAAELQGIITKDIEEILKANYVDAKVYNQKVASNIELINLAKSYNVSLGKMAFIKNLCQKDSSLKPEDLAKMTLRELEGLIVKNNIDISDMIHFDKDDSLSENIEEIMEEMDDDDDYDDDEEEYDHDDEPQIKFKETTITIDNYKKQKADVDMKKNAIDTEDDQIEQDYKAGKITYEEYKKQEAELESQENELDRKESELDKVEDHFEYDEDDSESEEND